MSFEKAKDLLRLADMAASRHRGVCLRDIEQEFGVARRTAQRMTQALTEAFPIAIDVLEDVDRTKRWRLTENRLATMRLSGADELEALDHAITRLDDPADSRVSGVLAGLRDRLAAAMPVADLRRAEVDAEALLEAFGMAARPGPVARVQSGVVEAISEALRGPFRLMLRYQGKARMVEPYGVLLGARRYLVARDVSKDDTFRHYRLDRMDDATVTDEWFARDERFSLESHAAQAFGSYHDPAQVEDVVWVFSAEAAAQAMDWEFHPGQTMQRLKDDRLEVRFTCGGWLEMAWHLYQWGDAVEVVAPVGLRDLVHQARRDDFEALP